MTSVYVFTYTMANALNDGVLVDVSRMAKEAGFRHPAAITRTAWERYVAVPEEVSGYQTEDARLWDILWMTRFRTRIVDSGPLGETWEFELVVANDESGPQEVTLKAVCGPGDQGEPVITIMMPKED